jgi:hypothetical protein
MKNLYLKNNPTLIVEEFQPKESNLIKVRLHTNGENGEGIWACVNDETKKLHDDDSFTSGYEFYATLRNDALAFYPNQSWGMVIPIKFNANERPECDIKEIDFDKILEENDEKPIFNMLDTESKG